MKRISLLFVFIGLINTYSDGYYEIKAKMDAGR